MKRREFLTVPAAAIGGTLLYTLAGEPMRLQAQNGTVKVPLRFFTAEEARVVTAACARIFPSDASGPGATEANVVIFIDRQLAGPYGRDKYRYTKGPFVESYPEHPCTVGVACWDHAETLDRFVGRADRALYAGKVSGRNRVVLDAV